MKFFYNYRSYIIIIHEMKYLFFKIIIINKVAVDVGIIQKVSLGQNINLPISSCKRLTINYL